LDLRRHALRSGFGLLEDLGRELVAELELLEQLLALVLEMARELLETSTGPWPSTVPASACASSLMTWATDVRVKVVSGSER